MAVNVKFKVGTQSQYNAIETKDDAALYWLTDTQRLYKGDVLFAVGTDATAAAAGLLSAEDKAKLDALVAADYGQVIEEIQGSIETINTSIETINSSIEEIEQAVQDVAVYNLVKDEQSEQGIFATYHLTKDGENIGEAINIPKDFLVKSGELKEVEEAGKPYAAAEVGDKYIDFVVNTKDASETDEHIYIPVSDLVDVYTMGEGISIVDGVVSINTETMTRIETAETNASDAVTKSEDAVAKAEEAVANSEEAVGKIDEAVEKVDEAIGKVDEAITKVDEANTTAQQANEKAEAASTKVDEVAAQAEEAAERAEQAAERIEQAVEGVTWGPIVEEAPEEGPEEEPEEENPVV